MPKDTPQPPDDEYEELFSQVRIKAESVSRTFLLQNSLVHNRANRTYTTHDGQRLDVTIVTAGFYYEDPPEGFDFKDDELIMMISIGLKPEGRSTPIPSSSAGYNISTDNLLYIEVDMGVEVIYWEDIDPLDNSRQLSPTKKELELFLEILEQTEDVLA